MVYYYRNFILCPGTAPCGKVLTADMKKKGAVTASAMRADPR
jgi:hypothetical protein